MMKLAKKCLAVLLAVVMVCSLASVAGALGLAEGTCGLHTTWTLSFTGNLSIGGNGDIKAYTQGVNSDYKKYSSTIKSVFLGAGVTAIGAYAFQGMTALTSVKMGDDVLRIDRNAFADCPLLTDITLAANLYSLGAYTFSNCTSLKKIVIPAGVSTLKVHTFDGCTSLQTVEVQNKNCSFASSNVFPQGVTVIGYKGSTAQTYAEKNGLAFKEIGSSSTDQSTTSTQPATQPTTNSTSKTDGSKCPLCGQTHEGFPGSLIGGLHSFIYGLLMLFGMRK